MTWSSLEKMLWRSWRPWLKREGLLDHETSEALCEASEVFREGGPDWRRTRSCAPPVNLRKPIIDL
jgi:hypothetical protein